MYEFILIELNLLNQKHKVFTKYMQMIHVPYQLIKQLKRAGRSLKNSCKVQIILIYELVSLSESEQWHN